MTNILLLLILAMIILNTDHNKRPIGFIISILLILGILFVIFPKFIIFLFFTI